MRRFFIHILDPMHQDKEVGKKIKKSVEEITAKLEKRLENPDTANMASALMEAASKQCRKENKKAYGETAENGPKTLEVLFLKRWLNQGVDDQDDEECLSGEKGQEEKVSCNRFNNVLEKSPELLLPRCALFHGVTMEEKRVKMREAIQKAMTDEQEEDKNSYEDAEDAEEESNGGLRGSSEVGF